jgi:hypothetical protein
VCGWFPPFTFSAARMYSFSPGEGRDLALHPQRRVREQHPGERQDVVSALAKRRRAQLHLLVATRSDILNENPATRGDDRFRVGNDMPGPGRTARPEVVGP